MPKKRKTKKQKLAFDSRQKELSTPIKSVISSTLENSTQLQHEKPIVIKPQVKNNNISTSDYAYLYPDLRKTIALTLIIIIVETLYVVLY